MTTVRQIMHPRVARIHPEASLAELVQLLAREGVSGVPVVKPDCSLAGVVSATDVLRLVAQQLEPGPAAVEVDLMNRKVKEIMTPAPFSVTPEIPVAELARLLFKRGIHRALVVEEGRLCGIVTAFDVLRAVSALTMIDANDFG